MKFIPKERKKRASSCWLCTQRFAKQLAVVNLFTFICNYANISVRSLPKEFNFLRWNTTCVVTAREDVSFHNVPYVFALKINTFERYRILGTKFDTKYNYDLFLLIAVFVYPFDSYQIPLKSLWYEIEYNYNENNICKQNVNAIFRTCT